MSMTDSRPIQFINTDHATVEQMLLGGKTPREISDLLAEPLPNVMGVWSQLRADGRVEARNFTGQVGTATQAPATPQAVPPRPAHTPNPELTQRIAGAADVLVKAADIDDKRIQAALGRARKAMTDLAGLVNTWESKSAARQRIARLEAELRIAKADLRDSTQTPTRQGGASPSQPMSEARRAQLSDARRASLTPVECSHCDKKCNGKAGLNSHIRSAHPGAA